jgi:hypothetical protein
MKLFFAGVTHADQSSVREQIRVTLKTSLKTRQWTQENVLYIKIDLPESHGQSQFKSIDYVKLCHWNSGSGSCSFLNSLFTARYKFYLLRITAYNVRGVPAAKIYCIRE